MFSGKRQVLNPTGLDRILEKRQCVPKSERVKCRFGKRRFSAELETRKKCSTWGGVSKSKSKSLGLAFALCRRARIDAALVKVQFSFHRCTPHRKKKKLQKKIKH